MAELKTKLNDASIDAFLDTVNDEKKRKDCYQIIKLMQEVTHHEPKMWGPAIIGFGSYHYKYASGHEGDIAMVAFSPRKASITLYLMCAIEAKPPILEKLGKYKTGKGCLYIKSMDDVDPKILKQLIELSFNTVRKQYQ